MKLDFTKMNGAENDFVMIDNRAGRLILDTETISRICDRRRGVGADGLILVQTDPGCDFHMDFYNADGVTAEMCGNGARCAAGFGVSLGMGKKDGDAVILRFSTDSGPVDAVVSGETATLAMMDAREMRRDINVKVAQKAENVHFIIVGTRHAVVFVENAREMSDSEVVRKGREIRHDSAFGPIGANVDFASLDGEMIHLRTYEKGVEAETHACGTGSVAAAVLYAHQRDISSPVRVMQRSGDELVVTFEPSTDGAKKVTLEGPIEFNFSGTTEI